MAHGLRTYTDDFSLDLYTADTPLKLEIGIPHKNMSSKQKADELLREADLQGRAERGEFIPAPPEAVVTISGSQIWSPSPTLTTTS